MAVDEIDEFTLGYTGPSTGADEWMIAPEVCKGIMLLPNHLICRFYIPERSYFPCQIHLCYIDSAYLQL